MRTSKKAPADQGGDTTDASTGGAQLLRQLLHWRPTVTDSFVHLNVIPLRLHLSLSTRTCWSWCRIDSQSSTCSIL